MFKFLVILSKEMILKNNKFSLKSRLASFAFAFSGLKTVFRDEANFKIHVISAFVVLGFAYYMELAEWEWIVLILCIGLVLIAETINTAIEQLCDHITPEQNIHIKKIKDIAAASVLLSTLVAVMIGLIIFLPKLL
jgi:diacylglycerol kinase (ATP)